MYAWIYEKILLFPWTCVIYLRKHVHTVRNDITQINLSNAVVVSLSEQLTERFTASDLNLNAAGPTTGCLSNSHLTVNTRVSDCTSQSLQSM